MHVSRFTCPEITSIGTESVHAPNTPFSALMPPGPVVTLSTAGFSATRAYPSAAIEHACSWCWQMGRMRDRANESFRNIAPPPVSKNTCWTPHSSRRRVM